MTLDQVRQARALLGWSRERLGGQCEISSQVVAIFENTGRIVHAVPSQGGPLDRLSAIQNALEAAGVEFTDGDAPGVRLRGVFP